MADSFFGFDTSASNLNDEDGGGEGSEEEYDALNDETFGQENDEFDWEVEHEHLAHQLESSRRHDGIDDLANSQLEASLSQLVLDETDAPHHTLGSSVWRHDPPPQPPKPQLKNVCTVEEIERQLRQNQQPINPNFFQPRFPVILQRPHGIQGPLPLPFAQQPMNHMNQPLNNMMSQNMNQNNLINHVNQMSQNLNQMGQNVNPMGQNANPMGQNVNPMGQNANPMGQNVNPMGQNVNHMSQNLNQFMQNNQLGFQNSHNQMMHPNQIMQNQIMNNMSQNSNSMGQNPNQMAASLMAQNMNHIGHSNHVGQNNISQNVNQMNQNVNQMGHNVNQMSQGMNQMTKNVNSMGQNVNPMSQNVIPMGQNVNQMNQNVNSMGQNVNPMGQSVNPMSQNVNQMSQNVNPMGPNVNSMGQNVNAMGQNVNAMGQSVNQMGQAVNAMGQAVNPMGQTVNPMGQNVNAMGQNMMNGGQFPMNQFPHLMGQTRMMGPPPGMNIPRQNFNPNMGQFNTNFRGPIPKPNEQPMINQQMMMKNQQMQQNQQNLPQNIPQNIPQNTPQNIPQNLPQNIPQSLPNMSQSPQKTKDKQLQKSRVFNSKTPNNMTNTLSSQGLVQLIQSTHPMLQPYNNISNSFHNANHHPMLNRTQQFVNQTMMQQRNGFTNNRIMMNGDDNMDDVDEYAGLMTQREKQWLMNIQMLQLNTGTPYIHDFYYTVFLERQAQKEKEGVKEAHKANQQNHPFYSGGVKQESMRRERHNSNRHNSTSEDPPRTYVPTQFENSLGKLQCGSVTAPRKIIDLEVVGTEQQQQRSSRAPSVASTTNPAEVPRELKRTKQLLLDIEALYLILLRIEELNDPLAISNALILKEREEKQKQLELALALETSQEDETNVFLRNIESVQRKKQDSPKNEVIDKRQVVSLALPQKPAPVKNLLDEDKDDLMNKMFLGLLHSDRLAQMLTVRKGRSLILRFVSRVPATHQRLRAVWARIMRALPGATRKYDTSSMAPLAIYYARYIENSSGWTAVLETCSLLAEALDPARTPHALSTSFTLSCVCALVEKATTLATTAEATANERQWYKFLKTLARALKHTSLNVARPIQPLQTSKLSFHLKQIDRGTIEILQRGKAHEFADLTKTDVHDQLLRHLC